MDTELSELLKREAEYAQEHKDTPVSEGTTVTHRGQRSRIFSLRLSEAEFALLERVADERGVPVSRLAREWITEKLAAESRPTDIAELAEAVSVLASRLASVASGTTRA
jgi:hypothetical protein